MDLHTWTTSFYITLTCLFAGHPRFFNQLSCGLDVVSMAGEWLTATANTNMFTYEIAPVFILMENVVLTKMREIIGWKGGDSIFAPGHNNIMLHVVVFGPAAARKTSCK